MAWDILILFAVTETALCLTPGPAVLLVVGHATRHGWKKAVYGALGIIAGNTVYFGMSAAGVATLVSSSDSIFLTVKVLGMIYLVYEGIRMWRAAHASVGNDTMERTSRSKLFFHGLVLQWSNPKAILFFAALLPQFIDPHRSVPLQCVLLGVTSVVIEFPILVGYAWLAHQGGRAVDQNGRFRRRMAGTVLIVVGILLGTSA